MAGTMIQQEVGRQVREAAEDAKMAVEVVLSDPKIRTHGLSFSQWTLLDNARRKLAEALA